MNIIINVRASVIKMQNNEKAKHVREFSVHKHTDNQLWLVIHLSRFV